MHFIVLQLELVGFYSGNIGLHNRHRGFTSPCGLQATETGDERQPNGPTEMERILFYKKNVDCKWT